MTVWPKETRLFRLHDHLCDALATKCLASDEVLLFQAGQSVACAGKEEEHGGGNQAGGIGDETEPLDQTHCSVDSGSYSTCQSCSRCTWKTQRRTHVVCGKPSNEGVELRRSRADSQQKRYLNEDQDDRAAPV